MRTIDVDEKFFELIVLQQELTAILTAIATQAGIGDLQTVRSLAYIGIRLANDAIDVTEKDGLVEAVDQIRSMV
ncbi:hypothetical protein L3556_06065 [Candidatus Synechococcus calcipolaris G9]|uniref:Uncharacterized protein n=1 Tax=Candidatus Synechococcus calcipolaris G9 TaxID=1497997 RepID=A0ABT6EZ28_9SYNE|nr:hypothetical protein [Candidatus Synechococcus calcipolaris]MDG2990500.1 hypothetical protein [Candidatus Synechococcus calcipolaris G9]